jgi:flagellar basal-body rod modification protein FlgD
MQTIQSTPLNPLTATAADASSSAPASSTAAGAATVSANDCLTLLVTELKNQDPTANTDPNAYVNQLVQVNSLQQLIQINQDTTPQSAAPATT